MKKIIFRIVLFSALLPSFSQAAEFNTSTTTVISPDAQSDDAQKYALAHQLINLMNYDENFKSTFDLLAKTLIPVIAKANPDQAAKVQKIIIDNMSKAMTAHIEELKNNSAMLYASTYALDELQQIVIFYQSDIGQKMVKNVPDILRRTMALNKDIIVGATKEGMRGVIDDLKTNGLVVPKELGSGI